MFYLRWNFNLTKFAQDSLVAAFPRIPDDDKNSYIRHELEYFL